MTQKKMKPDRRAKLLQEASTRLSEALGSTVMLENPRKLESGHFMFRCDVTGTEHMQSVILKQIDPSKAKEDVECRFRNEWASLAFIRGLDTIAPLAPRLHTSDREAGFMVIEDLGNLPTIQSLLFEDDEVLGERALVQMGTLLGQLHAASVGRETTFNTLQMGLEARSPESDSTLDLREKLDELRECFAGMRIETPDSFYEAVVAVEEAVLGPGPFRVFAHCDAGSHNFLFTGEDVRVMDFEYGAYTCGLLDIVPARLGFPPSYRSRRVPYPIVEKIEAAYRAEIEPFIPQASNDEHFHTMLVQASAHWALSRIEGFWQTYLKSVVEDGEERTMEQLGAPEERIAAYRDKVYTYIHGFTQAAGYFDRLHEIRKPVKAFLRAIRKMWPETGDTPYYPALEDWAEDED